MTIALLLLAAVVLMATMLFLTIGVNELEKKTMELSGLIKKRYAIRQGAKKAATVVPAAEPAPAKGKAKT